MVGTGVINAVFYEDVGSYAQHVRHVGRVLRNSISTNPRLIAMATLYGVNPGLALIRFQTTQPTKRSSCCNPTQSLSRLNSDFRKPTWFSLDLTEICT